MEEDRRYKEESEGHHAGATTQLRHTEDEGPAVARQGARGEIPTGEEC